MALDIVQGATTKPAASRTLVKTLEQVEDMSGRLFVGFPIIPTNAGRQAIDALWISEEKGVVAFDLVEGDELTNFQERQDDIANAINGRLRLDGRLMDRRELRIPIHTLSFAPQCKPLSDQGYFVVNGASVVADLLAIDAWINGCSDTYDAALSVMENVSTIRRSTKNRRSTGRSGVLKQLEDAIATLDRSQSRAVVETVDGVQRIRGLAGSGKTIVLALKAAYLHTLHPDWHIAITFYTRSLKGTFERLVRGFHVSNAGVEPDWSHLEIINAWGGRHGDGVYSEFCHHNGIPFLNFGEAQRLSVDDPFGAACQRALTTTATRKQIYDAVLVDEAQDLPHSFFRLCYSLLKKPKRLVYAYDELQRLSGMAMPPPEKLFGKSRNGRPRVELRKDTVLDTCYRNSRPTLLTAHALGFGIYRHAPERSKRQSNLVQMFDDPSLWKQVGYRVRSGSLKNGKNVVLYRDENASPRFLEDHSPIDDLVQLRSFEDEEKQAQWIVGQIEQHLGEDGLRHDDIVVINPEPRAARRKLGLVQSAMLMRGIDCHIAGVDADKDVFFDDSKPSIALSGVHRAKGNEAAMVYVINAQEGFEQQRGMATVRNRLFTAISRSKAWVRVSGVGVGMDALIAEHEKLVANDFELCFRYPTAEELSQIRTIHRDRSAEEEKKQKRAEMALKEVMAAIHRGDYGVDDIDPEIRGDVRKLFSVES